MTVREEHVTAVDVLQPGGSHWCFFSKVTCRVFVLSEKVYVRRQISECLERTSAKPINLLWIDTNKGDDVRENHRSRWVVREQRYQGEDGRALPALFSAQRPLARTKTLGSLTVTMMRSKRDKLLQMQFWQHCGLLVKSMYVTQDPERLHASL